MMLTAFINLAAANPNRLYALIAAAVLIVGLLEGIPK